MPNNLPVRALVGARVSSLKDEGKESHKLQRSSGEAYAESQGWEVVGAFEDLDVSAIKKSPWERPDLKVWLDKPEDWDALIFAKTDRVFRSAADCVRLAEWCKDSQKILVLVDDGIKLDYFHPEDAKDAFAGAMSKVFLILASVFAEIEGQRFVQRARDRVTQYRHQPRWAYGMPPFGFRVVDNPAGKGKVLAHDEDAQVVLRAAGARFLAGGSLTGIVTDLNRGGTLSPQDWNRARSGKPTRGTNWSVDKLRKMLRNPATQGVKTANGKRVLDAEGQPVMVGPASFDPETWARIQSELSQRTQAPRQRRHSTNPLLGVAKCGVCGKNMRQRSQFTPAGVTHRYYICGASPKACPRVSVIADEAETLVEAMFLRANAGRRIKERIWQEGSDHSGELEQTKQTIESLREDRALGLFTTPDDQEMFRSQMAALVARRDALALLPVVKAGWIEVETEQAYGQMWPSATPEARRKMLIDAEIVLKVWGPKRVEVIADYSKRLGEGSPDGMDELFAEMTEAGVAGMETWPPERYTQTMVVHPVDGEPRVVHVLTDEGEAAAAEFYGWNTGEDP